MARVEIPYVVERTVTVSGSQVSQPVSGASVLVNVRGGGAALVYPTETGGSPVANPLTTNADGEIEGWVEEGSYDLTISGSGITTKTAKVELGRADVTLRVPDGAVTLAKMATNSIGTAQIVDGSVTAAKLASTVSTIPAGTILPYGGATAPTGYLVCDGASYTTASQPALFNIIGYTYGGSGANFNVPDLRARVPVGADNLGTGAGAANRLPNSNRVFGQSGGSERHSHTVNNHEHSMQGHTHGWGNWTDFNPDGASYAGSGPYGGVVTGDHNHWVGGTTGGPSVGNTGGSSPGTDSVSVMQPYVIVNYLIKT